MTLSAASARVVLSKASGTTEDNPGEVPVVAYRVPGLARRDSGPRRFESCPLRTTEGGRRSRERACERTIGHCPAVEGTRRRGCQAPSLRGDGVSELASEPS